MGAQEKAAKHRSARLERQARAGYLTASIERALEHYQRRRGLIALLDARQALEQLIALESGVTQVHEPPAFR